LIHQLALHISRARRERPKGYHLLLWEGCDLTICRHGLTPADRHREIRMAVLRPLVYMLLASLRLSQVLAAIGVQFSRVAVVIRRAGAERGVGELAVAAVN